MLDWTVHVQTITIHNITQKVKFTKKQKKKRTNFDANQEDPDG
jgi:hypothetical protein